jgi:hypothetical protein
VRPRFKPQYCQKKLRIESRHLNIKGCIYKPISNIPHCKWGKIESNSSKLRTETRVSTLTTLINIVLMFLAIAIRQEKEIKIGKAKSN